MKRIESIEAGENDSRLTLECGHAILTDSPNAVVGTPWECPACAAIERRTEPQPCTNAQLDAVAADYAETMRARGIAIGKPEEAAIRRAAAIQDAWRVAFKRVLG
jgi:hypothetical protein